MNTERDARQGDEAGDGKEDERGARLEPADEEREREGPRGVPALKRAIGRDLDRERVRPSKGAAWANAGAKNCSP